MLFEKNLVPSTPRTASGNSGLVSTLGNAIRQPASFSPAARFCLNVTAVSGTTPTLDISIYGRINGVLFFLGLFTQATGIAQGTVIIDQVPETVQLFWTIGGTTPSFTFTVDVLRSPW